MLWFPEHKWLIDRELVTIECVSEVSATHDEVPAPGGPVNPQTSFKGLIHCPPTLSSVGEGLGRHLLLQPHPESWFEKQPPVILGGPSQDEVVRWSRGW